MTRPTDPANNDPACPRVIPLSARPEEYAAYIDLGAQVAWDETGYSTARRQGTGGLLGGGFVPAPITDKMPLRSETRQVDPQS